MQCYNCHGYGHYSDQCYKKSTSVEVSEQANIGDISKPKSLMLMAYHASTDEDVWILDTGASNHMCGSKHMFIELDETPQGYVSFGVLSKVPAKGRGNILIKLNSGGHSYITDVYYVPDIKHNLLSVGQLLEKGYDIRLKDHQLQFEMIRACQSPRYKCPKIECLL